MRLSSLVIKGFKSFADTVRIELEPGVTVVVGPNGSGKSNVVDAIAWVLGAQGPRALRGQRMDDVVFAGTPKRPALGRAEVSLTLDNSDGAIGIELGEVTITRTLFRDGESVYALNGAPCRLLDVQELLSDAGVGRTRHVVVAQGQIDAVLSARTEERRAVVEEAAGVLKHRRRKEQAERRLAGTEADQVRLADVLRELRRQKAPLARQAEAAARHDVVSSELAGLRLHLAAVELDSLEARRDRAARSHRAANEQVLDLEHGLVALDARLAAAESALTVSDDGGGRRIRLEGLVERCRGLEGRVAERRRSVQREIDALADETVITSLEADAATLGAELVEVDGVLGALTDELAELGATRGPDATSAPGTDGSGGRHDPETTARRSAAALSEARLDATRADAEAQAAHGELERIDAERRRLAEALTSLRVRRDERRTAREATAAQLARRAAASEQASRRAAVAEDDSATVTADREAEVARSERAAARAEALEEALGAARAASSVEALAGVDGVLGPLVELIDVEPGSEVAVEVALGEAVAGVVVASTAAARRALEQLAAADRAGVLLVPEALGSVVPDDPAGSADRVTAGVSSGEPDALEPLRPRVRGLHPGVDRLLDELLAGAVDTRTTVSEASAIAAAHPELVVVGVDGTRLARTGWRTGVTRAGVTAASVAAARADAAAAAEALARATARARATSRRAQDAIAAAAEARTAELATARRLDEVTLIGDRLDAEISEVDAAAAALVLAGDAAAARVDAARAAADVAAEVLSAAAAAADRDASAAEWRRLEDVRLAERDAAAAATRRDVEMRAATAGERRRVLAERLTGVEARLGRFADERSAAERRRLALCADLSDLDRLTTGLGHHTHRLTELAATARVAHRRHAEQLRRTLDEVEAARAERAAARTQLDAAVDRRQRAELDRAEQVVRIEAVVAALAHDHGATPEDARAVEPPVLDGVTAADRAAELERELGSLGPVNPLAVCEHAELVEREAFLAGQLDDVGGARRQLRALITSVDAEIGARFADAFADVAANFERLFERLFPGGSGALRLSDPADLLGTGIEIDARPSGKNVRQLSLLSGGERSLTALAFLFAVFESRPSPFYVMDEVEAALDEVNLARFLALVTEVRDRAQLLLVSHQKRTMEAADVLVGVTMSPGGSSTVVTERLTPGPGAGRGGGPGRRHAPGGPDGSADGDDGRPVRHGDGPGTESRTDR